MIKIISIIVVFIMGALILVSCGKKEIVPDFENESMVETALNNDEDVRGKIVVISVDEINPNSSFGYDIYSGEHLNFVSDDKPDAEVGDKITVKVKNVKTFVGSYIITYDRLK